MPHHSSRSLVSNLTIAEFIADREGLVGGARERFCRLLDQYGGFRERPRAPQLHRPIFVAILLALTGLFWEWPREWSRGLVWIEYTVLSTGLIWRLRKEERRSQQIDRETHWEAYRLFLRPVMLSDHPGLLDRNASHGRIGDGLLPSQSAPTIRRLIHERGPDFWWSILVGCWAGTGALVIIRQGPTATSWWWSIAFPASGLLLGFATWLLWRQLVFVMVRLDSRLADT